MIAKGSLEYNIDCNVDVKDYWNCKYELLVVEGIGFKHSKLVILRSLQKKISQKIHEGHLGIKKC